MVTIRRYAIGLLSLGFDSRRITDIHFYRDSAVVYRVGAGYIQGIGVGERDVPGMTLSSGIRRANRVNLMKGGHFYVPTKENYSKDKCCDLYIDLALGDFEVGEAIERSYTIDETGEFYEIVRTLTGRFASDERKTITVRMSGAPQQRRSPYGEKLAQIEARAAQTAPHLREIFAVIKDPKLLALMLEAAIIVKSVRDTPELQAVIAQFAD